MAGGLVVDGRRKPRPEPPEHMIIAILTQYEQGRWSLSLAGLNGHYPPDNDANLAELLTRLRSPVIAEMLKLMEPRQPSTRIARRATDGVITSDGARGSMVFSRWAIPPPSIILLPARG